MRLAAVGLALLAVSWLVLLLMVIGQIAPGLVLSLGAYAASVAGLVLGLLGVAMHVRARAKDGRPGP